MKSWLYSEPQKGKSAVDTHFSFFGNCLNQYVDDKNDLLVPADMLKAFKRRPIENTVVLLVEIAKVACGNNAMPPTGSSGSRSTSQVDWLGNYQVELWEQSGLKTGKTLVNLNDSKFKKWRAARKFDYTPLKGTRVTDSFVPSQLGKETQPNEKRDAGFWVEVPETASPTEKKLANWISSTARTFSSKPVKRGAKWTHLHVWRKL